MPLTDDAVANAIAQRSRDPFLIGLGITHADMATPIYIVRNRESIVSAGREFVAYPFEIKWPNDDDEVPQTQISVANVSRTIGKKLEALITPAAFTIELFLASDPTTAQRTVTGLNMTQASWNFMAVTMTIHKRPFWQEPYPKLRVTRRDFPGLFP